MDYSIIVNLLVEVIKSALPFTIIFLIGERLVNIFLNLAFPKSFKGGI